MTTEELNQYIWLIATVAVWDLIWKGIALWRAAKNNSRGWFIAMLILNTAGILPILYLYIFGREKKTS